MTEAKWKKHYEQAGIKNIKAAYTLTKALEFFEKEKFERGFAVDLGSGNGIDTIELLKRGWKVMAVDQEPEAHHQTLLAIPDHLKEKIITSQVAFEDIELPCTDLVNATFSIPFCHPSHFIVFWDKVVKSIPKGGRFSGQFFGVNDSWSSNPEMTFLTREEIKTVFKSFNVEYFHEANKDGLTISGNTKHWHVFHIVAKKMI
jgi:hypothetical protein